MRQVKLLEESEPTSPDSPHNIRMKLKQNDDDTESVDEKDNDSNYHEETTFKAMSSLSTSATNRTPLLGTQPYPANVGCDVENGENIPVRKIKSTSDAWITIKRIKSNSDI